MTHSSSIFVFACHSLSAIQQINNTSWKRTQQQEFAIFASVWDLVFRWWRSLKNAKTRRDAMLFIAFVCRWLHIGFHFFSNSLSAITQTRPHTGSIARLYQAFGAHEQCILPPAVQLCCIHSVPTP